MRDFNHHGQNFAGQMGGAGGGNLTGMERNIPSTMGGNCGPACNHCHCHAEDGFGHHHCGAARHCGSSYGYDSAPEESYGWGGSTQFGHHGNTPCKFELLIYLTHNSIFN